MKELRHLDCKNKKIIIRVDLNVPVLDGVITEERFPFQNKITSNSALSPKLFQATALKHDILSLLDVRHHLNIL